MKALGEKKLLWHLDRAVTQVDSLDYWVESEKIRIRKQAEESCSKLDKKALEIKEKTLKELKDAEAAAQNVTENVRSHISTQIEDSTRRLRWRLDRAEKTAERERLRAERAETEVEKIRARIEMLEEGVTSDEVDIKRAKTISIFDSILFAIENWATDDSPAPDFTIVSQSTLFPVVYERLGKGDSEYFLESVPDSAPEVVKRGREFVKFYREQGSSSLLDPETFSRIQKDVHEWWTRDGIPLLYGGSSEDWQYEIPYSLEQMLKWRDQPASRILDFPLISDGMDLVKHYGDEIRETTGLPEFSRQMQQTRIKNYD